MVGHIIEEVSNSCLSSGNQNTIGRNLLIYVRFTGRTWSQLTKVEVIFYQRNHTGNQQPLCSLTKAFWLQSSRAKKDIHPFFFCKCFSSISNFIHVYMRHLDWCQFTDTDWLCILLIFLNKLILHLQDTPDTTTEQTIIIFHIIRMNRNPFHTQIRECGFIAVFLGIQYNRNTVNHRITASFTQKRENLLCLIRTHIIISQNTLYVLYAFFNDLLVIRITVLSEEIFQYIDWNISPFTYRLC